MQSEIEAFEIGDYYTEYVSAFGPPHPDQVVETKFLSAVTVPVATYEPLIRDELVRSQPLSGLQIEALILACQRHLQHIDNGVRAGFFIGDGAGVGKGRTVAGLIWENWHHGRKKTLWVSTGSDLMFDARRDLNDVGARCIEMHLLSKLGYSKSKTDGVKEGVIFSTYRSLIASPRKGIRTRMQQLVEWCGDGFDGLIIFDECHKAKNLVPKKGRQPTRTGEAVRDIQAQLPEARVVYCSATGASEPRNMAYMVRLGLWGDGTYFPDFGEFLGALEKGGVGALELVAMDMKARGMYICRTLSYKGAEFETIEAKLDKEMKDAYEKASDVWVCLYEKLKSAISLLSEKPNTKNLWSLYWSSHQRFFRQLCISAKVPTAVELSKKALREDKCVVIGLQSTGESWTKKARSKHGSNLVEYTSGPRELLLNFVQDYYPLPKKPEILPAASVLESDHEPEGDEHVPRGTNTNELQKSYNTALKSKEKILMAIHALDLPNNPLDDIIEQLGGHDQVAEITGRKGSFVGKPIGGVIYEKRNTENVTAEMVNITEKKLFMDGKKLVAIISEAGSAGISLQADRSAKNQKRRVHLTLELPWSADRAIQQFGRTHRSNQVSVPEYRLLFTHLGGERRFASAVAKRLESLGALTQGDRRAGPSLSAYNYDSAYGKQALMDMYREIMGQGGTLPLVPQGCSSDTPDTIKDFISKAKYALASVGIFESTINDDKHDVEQFLNRILGIAPEFQNRIFDLFVDILDHLVRKPRIESNLDTGIVYLKSEVELKTEKKVYVDQKSGASTVLFTYEVSSKEVNVLSGVILPIWGNIKMALSKQVREIDKRPRIVHVETESDGIRRVGLLIPNAAVKTVLQDLTEVIKLVD